jgi:hypothetical protein
MSDPQFSNLFGNLFLNHSGATVNKDIALSTADHILNLGEGLSIRAHPVFYYRVIPYVAIGDWLATECIL